MNEGKLKASLWHIAGNTCTLGHGDERLIVVGETLTVAGPIFMCWNGLHACERLIDALAYANGTVICEVILGADAYTEADKSVSSSRTCIAMTTPEVGERILRNFARWCALDVAHLWDMPEDVRQYLETGDESVRSAAETTAWIAAGAAGEAAIRSAAEAAGESAAEVAAEAASRSAAEAAGESAAEAAVRERYSARLVEMVREIWRCSDER